MSQRHDSQTSRYSSLPKVREQPHEEDKLPLLQEEAEDNHPLQELLRDPPPHANSLFSHITSNPGTPSRNLASTSNLTPTVLATNPLANQASNPAQNPLAMPPAPAGMDLTIWANNQALIMSLIPTLQTLTSQNQAPPPRPPKEMDAQAPVKFLGDETSKLQDFLFECGLVFDAKPLTYATNRACVIYALQHLTSTAKHHFWRDIKQGYQTARVTLWAAFARELETIFGNPDRVKRATEKLVSLRINDSQHVHHYTVTFKECADELRWADDVLHLFYYRGLPDRIKDLWAQTNPPALYDTLVEEAQKADLCYWHRVDKKRKNPSTSKPSTSEQRSPDQKSYSGMPAKSGQSSRSPSSSTPNKTVSTVSSMPRTLAKKTDSYKDLSAVLGLDSKLLPEEKERHKKFSLCLCHGIKDDCPPPGFDKSSTPKTDKPASTFNTPKPKVSRSVSLHLFILIYFHSFPFISVHPFIRSCSPYVFRSRTPTLLFSFPPDSRSTPRPLSTSCALALGHSVSPLSAIAT